MPVRYSVWPIAVLFFGFLFPMPAAAQSAGSTGIRGSYDLSGYVRDDENRVVLQSANVQLTRDSGDLAAPTVYTGTTGEFLFSGLGSGDYHVTASLHGYETASTVVRIGGTVLLTIELSLHKAKTTDAFAAGEVSAHELTVPFNARDDYEKGIVFLTAAKPNYNRAVTQFERAIKEFSTYYEAYAEMSIAYFHLGKLADAENSLRTSVKLSKNEFPEALLLLAEMLDEQNRFLEAEPVARQAVTVQDGWRGHLALARALAGLRRANEAEVDALKASTLNPTNPQIFLVLGNIHIQQRKYAAVVKDFGSYLSISPTGPQSDAVRATLEQAKKVLQRTQATVN